MIFSFSLLFSYMICHCIPPFLLINAKGGRYTHIPASFHLFSLYYKIKNWKSDTKTRTQINCISSQEASTATTFHRMIHVTLAARFHFSSLLNHTKPICLIYYCLVILSTFFYLNLLLEGFCW